MFLGAQTLYVALIKMNDFIFFLLAGVRYKSLACHQMYPKCKCEDRQVSGLDPNPTCVPSSSRSQQWQLHILMVSVWVEEPQARREDWGADNLLRSLSSSCQCHHQEAILPLGCDPVRLLLREADLI